MFEATLFQGDLFKKIITAISDLVQDGNFQIDGNHISFQGMDSSHVSLVSLSLKKEGFNNYICTREITLGINFSSLNKILKCMNISDKLILKCEYDSDKIFICFENSDSNRLSNFELKLMDIDQEQLGIPETIYSCYVQLLSSSFTKIIRDLSALGDSVTINVNKQGVKFTVNGDVGRGEIQLSGMVKKLKQNKTKDDKESNGNDDDNKEDDSNKNNNEEDIDIKAVDGDEDNDVLIKLNDDVSQTFALKYLLNFTKASILSKYVCLSMGSDVPLMCSYEIESLGNIAYYLAPKIDDDE